MRKKFRHPFGWMVKRELMFLDKLKNYPNFPKVLGSGPDYIDLSYCGNRQNIKGKEIQCYNILRALKEQKIKSRDINPKNMVTLNGKVTLLDFAWSTMNEEKDTPVPAPSVLGGKYYQNKDYSYEADERAMNISLADGVYK